MMSKTQARSTFGWLAKWSCAALLFSLGTSSLVTAQSDPTFNGMVKLLHCSVTHRAICSGEYCSDFTTSVGWNNIWIDIQNGLIGPQFPLNNSSGVAIRVVETSDAGLNKVLFQKLQYGDNQMLISYYPNHGQMMNVRFGVVSKTKPTELAKGLVMDKIIDTGQCEIQ